MSSLTDDIFSQLSRTDMQQIGQQLGTGQAQTAGAIAAALPMILGAMGRNTSQSGGADAQRAGPGGQLPALNGGAYGGHEGLGARLERPAGHHDIFELGRVSRRSCRRCGLRERWCSREREQNRQQSQSS